MRPFPFAAFLKIKSVKLYDKCRLVCFLLLSVFEAAPIFLHFVELSLFFFSIQSHVVLCEKRDWKTKQSSTPTYKAAHKRGSRGELSGAEPNWGPIDAIKVIACGKVICVNDILFLAWIITPLKQQKKSFVY